MFLERLGRLNYWFPVIFWMTFIFWMSTGTFSSENTSLLIEPILRFLMPGISPHAVDMIHGLIRKCGHITEYFILGLLLFRAFHHGTVGPGPLMSALCAVIVVVIAAAFDEFHQSFVPTRTASIVDVLFDTTGGLLAQLASLLRRRRKYT